MNSRDGRGETQMMVSERPLAKVETVSVTGSNALTFSQIYRRQQQHAPRRALP